jgi:hypothetical protein
VIPKVRFIKRIKSKGMLTGAKNPKVAMLFIIAWIGLMSKPGKSYARLATSKLEIMAEQPLTVPMPATASIGREN